MAHREDIQKLIESKNRRLQKLRVQEALKGINSPPELLIEIEDIQAELARLKRELQTASSRPDTSVTGDESAPSSTRTGGVHLSHISGNVYFNNVSADVSAGSDIVGGDKITSHTTSTIDPAQAQAILNAALAQWRDEVAAMLAQAQDLDKDDKTYVATTADKLIEEARKGGQADPDKLEGFFKRLSNMAPDLLEVTATILQNPFKGVGLVLKKIDNRIKLERASR